MSLCWREDSLAAVVQSGDSQLMRDNGGVGLPNRSGGVSCWAETRVVVRRCGGVPDVSVSSGKERHTNQTFLASSIIATRVFDPEMFSSRRIAIMTG